MYYYITHCLYMCESTKEEKQSFSLVFSFPSALRSVNGTQTSLSREMIQSVFISWTHSSTCQVGFEHLNNDWRQVWWWLSLNVLTSSPHRSVFLQRPTSLPALWISSPTVTHTQGKEVLVTLSVMQLVSVHSMVTQRPLQAKLGQEQALQHGRVQVSQLLI